MSKIVFTCGHFDCLGRKDFHLIHEMRKLALPDGEIAVVLFDDYSTFVNTKKFPIQALDHRKNNLEYVCKNITISFSNNPADAFKYLVDDAANKGQRLIYMGYEDDKEFPGKELLTNAKISMRFIKYEKQPA